MAKCFGSFFAVGIVCAVLFAILRGFSAVFSVTSAMAAAVFVTTMAVSAATAGMSAA